jgi:hypothetical protein
MAVKMSAIFNFKSPLFQTNSVHVLTLIILLKNIVGFYYQIVIIPSFYEGTTSVILKEHPILFFFMKFSIFYFFLVYTLAGLCICIDPVKLSNYYINE